MRPAAIAFVFPVVWACAPTPGKVVSPKTDDEPAPDAALIDVAVLLGQQGRSAVDLSFDGRKVLVAGDVDGANNLWIVSVDDVESARTVTDEGGQGIDSGVFTGDASGVLYTKDDDGDENTHVYFLDLAIGKTTDLTPYDNTTAFVGRPTSHAPSQTTLIANYPDPTRFDVLTVELSSGKVLGRQGMRGCNQWLFDRRGALRALGCEADGGRREFRVPHEGGFRSAHSVGSEDAESTEILWVDPAAPRALLATTQGRGTAAVVELDLRDGRIGDAIVEDDKAGVDEVFVPAGTSAMVAARVNGLRPRWQLVDEGFREHFDVLSGLGDGVFSIDGQSADGAIWLVGVPDDEGTARDFVYDARSRVAKVVAVDAPQLEGLPLVPLHPIEIEARDGLTLPSYLSLPYGSDPDRDGRPQDPVPMVLLVHGGPWDRDSWGYHFEHQWLANRGYAVLSVNFRSSTGFTRTLLNAGDRQWGAAMHDDLIDGVTWAIENGVAVADRIAIFGGSYGGYASLVGLTKTPTTFACGVDIMGPSNLPTFIESVPPRWEMFRAKLARRIGDVSTEPGRAMLRERSPLFHADQIERPLLVIHGANDPRVPQSESDALVDAVAKRDVPVTYVVFPDEGHGFARQTNQVAFTAIAEGFLAGCLGGRAAPIGESVEDSSAQIRVGAEHVVGLGDHRG